MTEREIRWHQIRCGKCTSSKNSDLLTRASKTAAWGKTATKYLYAKRKELRTGVPAHQDDNKNFRAGRESEPMAIEWMRANTMYDIKHCSVDFDEIRVTSGGIDDYLDSLDFIADDKFIGEIKCIQSDEKFEYMTLCTKADVVDEYKEQFAGHFLGNPEYDKLLYLVYRAQEDEDEMDVLNPLDKSRGIIFEYHRSEFEGLIEEIKERVRIGMAAVRRSLLTGEKLETILNS